MAGKRINVTRREFTNSYRSHYKMYKNTSESSKTRKLVLFYSVECGLKSYIMQTNGCNTYEELVSYCMNSSSGSDLTGHDIKAMLKQAIPGNQFPLKDIQLKNGGYVNPQKFNELWRYGAEVAKSEEEEDAEKTLEKIVEWLHMRI